MVINMLMQYLKDTQKIMNIQFREGIINDVKINFYELYNNHLFIYLNQGHELRIDVSSFKIVRFDAIVLSAKVPTEMHICLEHLKEYKKFNAYLEDQQDNSLLSFLFICDENNPK